MRRVDFKSLIKNTSSDHFSEKSELNVAVVFVDLMTLLWLLLDVRRLIIGLLIAEGLVNSVVIVS